MFNIDNRFNIMKHIKISNKDDSGYYFITEFNTPNKIGVVYSTETLNLEAYLKNLGESNYYKILPFLFADLIVWEQFVENLLEKDIVLLN